MTTSPENGICRFSNTDIGQCAFSVKRPEDHRIPSLAGEIQGVVVSREGVSDTSAPLWACKAFMAARAIAAFTTGKLTPELINTQTRYCNQFKARTPSQ